MPEPIPADLLDALARIAHDDIGGCCEYGYPCDDSPLHRAQAKWFLAALIEHYAGSLIDPSTWTRVRAERYKNGVELCIVHDEVKVETHDPSGGCAEAWGADCETVPLYTLTREES